MQQSRCNRPFSRRCLGISILTATLPRRTVGKGLRPKWPLSPLRGRVHTSPTCERRPVPGFRWCRCVPRRLRVRHHQHGPSRMGGHGKNEIRALLRTTVQVPHPGTRAHGRCHRDHGCSHSFALGIPAEPLPRRQSAPCLVANCVINGATDGYLDAPAKTNPVPHLDALSRRAVLPRLPVTSRFGLVVGIKTVRKKHAQLSSSV